MNDRPIGVYNFSVNCVNGLQFSESKMLNLAVSVDVQTDKAIYKANDTVRFRVFVLDQNLKPLNAAKVYIYLADAEHKRVKHFPTAMTGVFQDEFHLFNSPILGNWSIVVLVNNKVERTKTFQVAEYTLPTFEVLVDVIQMNKTTISASITAKHIFGEMAKGIATITAIADSKNESRSVEVNGKQSIEFNDLGLQENSDQIVNIFVTFTEELTGKVQNTSTSIRVRALPYHLSINKEPEKFKAGLRVRMEMLVLTHNNLPITDDSNPVTFLITFFEKKMCKRRSRLSSGRNAGSVNRTVEYYPSRGIAILDEPVPRNVVNISVTVKYLEETLPEIRISRETSASNRYIMITSKTRT